MPNPILTSAIDALASRRDLSEAQAAEVLAQIMHGEVSETQIAAFLIALRTKGETVQELAGMARTMRELAAHVPSTQENLLDTAGTGGGRRTFNVSTTAALIAAGAGCAVAKHGNRSATGPSGSADVLEALGARIDLDPEGVGRCIEEAGFGFMFAPAHHRATRFVVPVRHELGVRTIFNMLGPLTNPAGASRQLIGVSDPGFLETIAGALALLGSRRALVVHGEDGLDEISTSAPTTVVELDGSDIRRYTVAPEEFGIESLRALPDRPASDRGSGASAPASAGDSVPTATTVGHPALAGGSPAENAAVTRAILDGESGPRADLALVNAGAAIYAAGAVASIAEGVEAARAALADGSAAHALQSYVEATLRYAPAEAAR
jgi:anthranilate phosphoribosyltransferase